jgi:hypothetical protein
MTEQSIARIKQGVYIEGQHLECPIKCGHCCDHFVLGPVQCLLGDKVVEDKMKWITSHGEEGLITCARTLEGFDIVLRIPCRHFDAESRRCKVYGTAEQPDNCKGFLCDKARNRLAVEEYKKGKSRMKV